jgi:hypothetical protein
MRSVLQHASLTWLGLQAWLARPDRAARRWLGPMPACAAWLGMLLAVCIPPHGTGITVCWMNRCTGIPCPGCGLTRSLSCGLRGLFPESFHYHPLGLLILALFTVICVVSLLPGSLRQRVTQYLEARAVCFNSAYLLFVVVFVGFGLARALQSCFEAWLLLP